MTEGARRYVPVAETIETEELEGLCREICREMVPNWDIGAGPSPGPGATATMDATEGGRGGGGGATGGADPGMGGAGGATRGGGGGGTPGGENMGGTGPELGMEGVGTAMGMPIPLLPLFSRLLLPPLLPLCVRCLWLSDAVRPGLFC